ncbi:MAG: cysteine--tRNA ligase, partial [Pseudomonadota bacterium]
ADDISCTAILRGLNADDLSDADLAASLGLLGFDLASETEIDVSAIISERLAFIADKNWAEADRIRDELLAQGIQLKDGKDPETGERVTTWEVVR